MRSQIGWMVGGCCIHRGGFRLANQSVDRGDLRWAVFEWCSEVSRDALERSGDMGALRKLTSTNDSCRVFSADYAVSMLSEEGVRGSWLRRSH